MNTLEFAKKILEIPSPSGYTKNIIEFLKHKNALRDNLIMKSTIKEI